MPATLTAPPRTSAPRLRFRHVLHTLYPRSASRVLTRGTLEIGREASLVIDDAAVSARHCAVDLGSAVTVRDLGSKNGTWRFGVRISEATLCDGDVLRVGGTFLLYRIEPGELLDAAVPQLRGSSPAIRALRAEIGRLAPTRATVVLLGETGTGKTLAAEAIHALSGRRGPLIHVNCAAIHESTAESELFGHKAGAFTDARADTPGKLRAADRGTLFLDEVAELTPATQARLLLPLADGRVTPVGGVQPVSFDARVITATNRDLPTAVESGAFREDLYARLAEVCLTLPPLRTRREDILLLLAPRLAAPLSPDLVDVLLSWHWPRNVRELEKLSTSLNVRGEGLPTFGVELLDKAYLHPVQPQPPSAAPSPTGNEEPTGREDLERLLEGVHGNVTELARRLDRPTKQIYRWCARWGLDPASFRP